MTDEKREELEPKKETIVQKMKAEWEARNVARMETIINHTTKVANEKAETIKTKLDEKFAPLDAMFRGKK